MYMYLVYHREIPTMRSFIFGTKIVGLLFTARIHVHVYV